jgi:HPt (histidine-containing phosphotransfer) domain-containing protein
MIQNNLNRYSLISLSSEELSSINGGNLWDNIQSAAHKIAVYATATGLVAVYVVGHQLDILSNYGDGFSAGANQAVKK